MNTGIPELTRLANRPTNARLRAEAMGWIFDRIEVRQHDASPWMLVMRVDFRCICGTKEGLVEIVDSRAPPYVLEHILDPAENLRRRGSFSRSHLLADGFSEQQIAECERKGREFDKEQECLTP